MTSKYNRKYKEYKPTNSGPPTERICKRVNCTGPGPICINIDQLPILGIGSNIIRPKLPCVFGIPTDITLLSVLP